jgi:hypothetical protein
MRQINVSLPDDMRTRLEEAARAAGHTLGTEVRNRLARSLSEAGQLDPATQVLMLLVARLATLIQPQTGHQWFESPGAHRVLEQAIASLLARWRPQGDPILKPEELPPGRPVRLDGVEEMGVALEGIASYDAQIDRQYANTPLPLGEAEMRQAAERITKAMFQTHQPPQRADTTGLTRLRKPKRE